MPSQNFQDEVMKRFDDLQAQLTTILINQQSSSTRETTIMANLDDILSNEADEATQIGVIQTMVENLRQQLADALSGVTLPPAVQAKVDEIFTQASANKQALTDLSQTPT